MRVIKTFLFLVLALIVGVFGAHNSRLVPVDFYPFNLQLEVAVFLLFFVALVVGVILSGMVMGVKVMHMRKLVRLKKKEIKRLEEQLSEMRAKELVPYENQN